MSIKKENINSHVPAPMKCSEIKLLFNGQLSLCTNKHETAGNNIINIYICKEMANTLIGKDTNFTNDRSTS